MTKMKEVEKERNELLLKLKDDQSSSDLQEGIAI